MTVIRDDLKAATAPYVARIDSDFQHGHLTSEELFRAEEQVKALLEHPGWVFVQNLLERAREAAMTRLLYRTHHEHARLERDLGLLTGLGESVAAAHAVLAASEKTRSELERIFRDRESREE